MRVLIIVCVRRSDTIRYEHKHQTVEDGGHNSPCNDRFFNPNVDTETGIV